MSNWIENWRPLLKIVWARFHEITDKWIREHRQEYRGNRSGDLQDAYLDRINAGEEHFSAEVTEYIHTVAGNICFPQNLAAIVREIFVIGAESESVMMRWVDTLDN